MTWRQQLAESGDLPEFTYYFGFHPWQVDDLTPIEMAGYLSKLDAIRAEHERAREKAEKAEQQAGRSGGRSGS